MHNFLKFAQFYTFEFNLLLEHFKRCRIVCVIRIKLIIDTNYVKLIFDKLILVKFNNLAIKTTIISLQWLYYYMNNVAVKLTKNFLLNSLITSLLVKHVASFMQLKIYDIYLELLKYIFNYFVIIEHILDIIL